MSEVMKPGDVILIRVSKPTAAPKPLEAALDQIPEVQGALTAIDPASRRVVAISGGYDFEVSPFNRATQAQRQPGSAFKPFLYAAAMASQKFTPMTVVHDAPEAVRHPYTGKTSKPPNYARGGFARRAGIHSPLPDNLTLALGTGEVSPLELANAYTTLHSLGKYADAISLIR